MIAFNATDAETFPNFSVATAENDRVTAAQRVRWAQPHRGARFHSAQILAQILEPRSAKEPVFQCRFIYNDAPP